MASDGLRPAALAFDTVAPIFDARFGPWKSVAAQRVPVRQALAAAFPAGALLIELGGGTGEDAAWLAARGIDVLSTDVSPTMVAVAAAKLAPYPGSRSEIVAAEDLPAFAARFLGEGGQPFDGAFSNFAALNCVEELAPVARGLARLVRPGGAVFLVVFGPFPPGEVVVEALRGRWRAGFRRLARGAVAARLGGHHFTVRYHRPGEMDAAMSPWFAPEGRTGVGIFVPPSAAEPWISDHPRLLRAFAALDAVLKRPLALLGDHVIYEYRRNDVEAGE